MIDVRLNSEQSRKSSDGFVESQNPDETVSGDTEIADSSKYNKKILMESGFDFYYELLKIHNSKDYYDLVSIPTGFIINSNDKQLEYGVESNLLIHKKMKLPKPQPFMYSVFQEDEQPQSPEDILRKNQIKLSSDTNISADKFGYNLDESLSKILIDKDTTIIDMIATQYSVSFVIL